MLDSILVKRPITNVPSFNSVFFTVVFNNIDVKASSARGISVNNKPRVLTDPVADHACALLLSTGRRIPESDKYVRAGKYKGWEPMLMLGGDLKGRNTICLTICCCCFDTD